MAESESIQRQALSFMAKIHSSLRGQVDFSSPSKSLAVYLLEGAAITTAFTIYKIISLGDHRAVLQLTRFVHECIGLSKHFSVEKNKQDLEKWFNGEIIASPKSQRKLAKERYSSALANTTLDELQSKFDKDKNFFKEFKRDFDRLVFDDLSKWTHPSLDAVRFNCTQTSYEFDYECKEMVNYPIKDYSFPVYVIDPVLVNLFDFSHIFRYRPEDWSISQTFRKQLHENKH